MKNLKLISLFTISIIISAGLYQFQILSKIDKEIISVNRSPSSVEEDKNNGNAHSILPNKSNEENYSKDNFKMSNYILKVIFSSIFCIAALFIILSKNYDEDTKKWAFSVLTLIAGVWIGTISV